MKLIVLLAGFGSRMRPHTWSRPKALLHVAGNTVLGHLLGQLSALTLDEVIFVVGYKGTEIEAWVRQTYPKMNVRFVEQPEPLGQAHALWLCRDFIDDGELFVMFGDGIINAPFETVSESSADGVALVQEIDDPRKFGVGILDNDGYITQIVEKPETMAHKLALVGAYWFRNGRSLTTALDRTIAEERKTKGEYYLADTLGILLEDGFKMTTLPVKFWLDTGNPADMLQTNERLLGLGYGSEDAIDRSYGEDFTVIPPVFLHETAVIDNCVIGPYVTIGENVQMSRSVVSNSIIEADATLEDVNLDQSLIGKNATLKGASRTVFVGDNSEVDFG